MTTLFSFLEVRLAVGALVGAALASWLCAAAYRIPRGMDIVSERSVCDGCRVEVGARDNLPIVGWLLLRGRCRHCQVAIPARYFAYEIAGALAGAAVCALSPVAFAAAAVVAIAGPLVVARRAQVAR